VWRECVPWLRLYAHSLSSLRSRLAAPRLVQDHLPSTAYRRAEWGRLLRARLELFRPQPFARRSVLSPALGLLSLSFGGAEPPR